MEQAQAESVGSSGLGKGARIAILLVILAIAAGVLMGKRLVPTRWEHQSFVAEASGVGRIASPGRELADWPQFQGPRGDATVALAAGLKSWGPEGPKRLWSVPVGPGFGGPAIVGEEVFLLDRASDTQTSIRSLSLQTGKGLWQHDAEVAGRVSYPGSRSVPAVTKERVFATGPLGRIYALERTSGRLLWEKNMVETWGAPPPGFGFAISPIVVAGRVIIAPQSAKAGLVALDPATGTELWRSPSLGGTSYATPVLARVGKEQHLVFHAASKLHGLEPESGRLLWSYEGYKSSYPIPSPTSLGDGRIFLTSGYKAGSVMLRVSKNATGYELTEEFRIKFHGSQVQPALYYDGHLYANFNMNENIKRRPNGLTCLDMTGKLLWRTKKSPRVDRGNLILVGNTLVSIGGEDGVLRLAEATPRGFSELCSAKVFDKLKRRDNQIWAPMAWIRGRLLVRSQSRLICLEVPQ